jgi:hypothetical protein
MEDWKPVVRKNFSHIYEVSDKGTVRKIKGTSILSTTIRNGYKSVSLYNAETKKKNTVNVHRLMAIAFLGNSGERKMVNHKNGDKLDNRVENLEWVTPKENTAHAVTNSLQISHPKRVKQYTKDGVYIQTFDSILKASEKTGANDRHISCVCKGKRKTTGGFVWKYETSEEIHDDCDGKIIIGFPNYKITKDGKVYSKRARKFLVPKVLQSGYECVKLCNKGVCKDAYIKKLVREYYPSDTSVPNHLEKSDGGSGKNSEVWEESEDRDNPVPSS